MPTPTTLTELYNFLVEFSEHSQDKLINVNEVITALSPHVNEELLVPEAQRPYLFYRLRTLQDAFAFFQRAVFHINLMGFQVQATCNILPTKGHCPRCTRPMRLGELTTPELPSQPTEKIQGMICEQCKLFVPIPQPTVLQLCPICREPVAQEPTGARCVACEPLQITNRTESRKT